MLWMRSDNRRNKWILVHGFNRDESLFLGLSGDLADAGIPNHIIDYGRRYTLFTDHAVQSIIEECNPGCNIIAHSNGCLAAYAAALEHGLWIRNLIMIQPPMQRDIWFPPSIDRVASIWNRGDKVVSWARRYNAALNMVMAWRRSHHQYYGDMGRYGPAEGSRAVSVEVSRLYGHSGMLSRRDWRAVVLDLL
jgi:pimeloyl-ACP methyl ester carboxylesterase